MVPDLIEKIANVDFGGKRRRNYSFATKYCNFHRPDIYPIYDSLIVGVLSALLRQGERFDTRTPGEHWGTDYAIWHRSISRFRTHYGLERSPSPEHRRDLFDPPRPRSAPLPTSPPKSGLVAHCRVG